MGVLSRLALAALAVGAGVLVAFEADRRGTLGYARHVKASRFRRNGKDVERKRDCESGRFLKSSRKANDCVIPKPTPWYLDTKPVDDNAVCYATRGEALRAFVDVNQHAIDAAGGLRQISTDGSWDAVNERYGLRGRSRVKSVREALEAVMPAGKPYCLDQLDLETLNETRPAQEAGGFRLPDAVEEARLVERQAREYEGDGGAVDWDVPADDF